MRSGAQLRLVCSLTLVLGGLVPLGAQSQTDRGVTKLQAVREEEEHFVVVSIRPSKLGGDLSFGVTPDGYSAKNAPVFWVMMDAWFPRPMSYWRIKGAPEWVEREAFDIEARVDDTLLPELNRLSARQRETRIKAMVRRMLAERFHLECHLGATPARIYKLSAGKNVKLKEPQPASGIEEAKGLPISDGGSLVPENNRGEQILHFSNTTMPALAEALSGLGDFSDDPVEDATGLSGHYDFVLRKRVDELPATDAEGGRSTVPRRASNWEVEPLGLKLVAARGLVQALFVDRIEHPSGN